MIEKIIDVTTIIITESYVSMKINKLINEGIINPPTEPEIVFPGLILGAIILPFKKLPTKNEEVSVTTA